MPCSCWHKERVRLGHNKFHQLEARQLECIRFHCDGFDESIRRWALDSNKPSVQKVKQLTKVP
jgi:hypothetical protein